MDERLKQVLQQVMSGERLKGNTPAYPNAVQRQILDRLRPGDWRRLVQIDVPVNPGTLDRLLHRGWVEARGLGKDREIKITEAGFEALTAKIPRSTLARAQVGTSTRIRE